jgi:hypothetical protein
LAALWLLLLLVVRLPKLPVPWVLRWLLSLLLRLLSPLE